MSKSTYDALKLLQADWMQAESTGEFTRLLRPIQRFEKRLRLALEGHVP